MKKILTTLLIFCTAFMVHHTLFAQLDDGVCAPTTIISATVDPAQATVCSDGSDAIVFAATSGSLPDAEYVVEVNGAISVINVDGSIDPATLAIGDQVCVTGFTYDLAFINDILTQANGFCPVLDCDAFFGIPGITQAIMDLVNGVNDGNPGLNDLQEALDFAGSFGTPIVDVTTAATTLDALNAQIGGIFGNICYATAPSICYDIVDCTPVCTASMSTISTTDPTRICIDGVGDPINVAIDVDGGATGTWVITDAAATILALPAGPPFDLDGAGAGQCLIWYVNSDDAAFTPMVGDDAAAAVAASSCAFLSNSITVDRIEVTAPTISTTDPTDICADDGIDDLITPTVDAAGIGANTAWVITDAAGTILALPPSPPFNLEGAGAGTCLIWLVNYEDPTFAPAMGDDAAAAVAAATCAVLSNSIAITRAVGCGTCEEEITYNVGAGVCDMTGATVELLDAAGVSLGTMALGVGGGTGSFGVQACGDYSLVINGAPACYTDEGGDVGPRAFNVDGTGTTTAISFTLMPTNVPTVGEWGLIILGLMMSITAVVGIRQRRREEIYG